MDDINSLIDEIDAITTDPNKGLPEEVFLFASRITPMVNVDLLIRNENNETLLTWRGGRYYSPGWHVPGGIVRYKESIYERIQKMALLELGTEVIYEKAPILINEVIRSPERKNRGHFISFLFMCQLSTQADERLRYSKGEPQNQEWMWHKKCPADIIPVHLMYKEVLNGEKPLEECTSDFGISRIILYTSKGKEDSMIAK